MTGSPLDSIGRTICRVDDAVRWACILEATAPKPGNVHPSASFHDLRYVDFVLSADILANCLCNRSRPIGDRVLNTIEQTKEKIGSNVNLGIALLLAPLVETHLRLSVGAVVRSRSMRFADELLGVVKGITPADSRSIFAAIALADAGGMKLDPSDVDSIEMDVNAPTDHHEDLLMAMRLAAPRDRIALQYATGFDGVLVEICEVLDASIRSAGDVLGGIVDASIEIIARHSDSLIIRKNGEPAGRKIQQIASEIDRKSSKAVDSFDQRLRTNGNALNPGTTADLIAAGLFCLLQDYCH